MNILAVHAMNIEQNSWDDIKFRSIFNLSFCQFELSEIINNSFIKIKSQNIFVILYILNIQLNISITNLFF